MGFTIPCFIRKNTPELRDKLKKLGIIEHPSCIETFNDYLYVGRGFYNILPIGYSEEIESAIDCGTNEEFFLAIAALRDDADKFQWFTDGNKWIQCPDIKFSTYWVYNNIDINLGAIHKATVEELIEYFRGKEG